MTTNGKVMSIAEGVATVGDGASVGVGGIMFQRKPIALCRALATHRARSLRYVSFTATLDAEILADAGCLAELHAAYVGLDRLGKPAAITRLRDEGTLVVREYSEWMVLMGLQAGQFGLPFWPSRAPSGSDLVVDSNLRHVSCPYTGESVLAIPAIRPDVALIHAWRADSAGNVQWPWPPDGVLDADLFLARSARRVIVSVEELVDSSVLRREARDTRLVGFEVDTVVVAPGGSAPTACRPAYDEDWSGLVEAAGTRNAG
jgi:glutaconate CoA-transferase subunit A